MDPRKYPAIVPPPNPFSVQESTDPTKNEPTRVESGVSGPSTPETQSPYTQNNSQMSGSDRIPFRTTPTPQQVIERIITRINVFSIPATRLALRDLSIYHGNEESVRGLLLRLQQPFLGGETELYHFVQEWLDGNTTGYYFKHCEGKFVRGIKAEDGDLIKCQCWICYNS